MKLLILSLFHFFLAVQIRDVVTISSVEDYMNQRKLYFEAEDAMSLGDDLIFNEVENRVNQILMKFKDLEFKEGLSSNGDYFPASQHFFHARDIIENSNVFKIIKTLPKGGSLHMHEFTVGPMEYVATNLSKWENLYYCHGPDDHLQFHFYPDQPLEACNLETGEKWTLVEYFRRNSSSPGYIDALFTKSMSMFTTTPAIDYPDPDRAWYFFDKKIATIQGILNYDKAFRDYYYKTLKEFYDDNVMYIEMRGIFEPLHRLDGTLLKPIEVIQLLQEVTEEFKADHPKFMGAKAIFAPHRFRSAEELQIKLNEALEMNERFPNFFAGFDVVGQEDRGFPLLNFISNFLEAKSKGLQFYFHAGETGWRGTPIDENLFDAVLLNTSRIGHGYALAKHPYLVEVAKERGIAVEICPISNQVLGLVKDIRNHPAKSLLQKGFPAVISSDGPGIWGSRGLSHDFYYAFMGIAGSRADLKFLKQLAVNSITYSSMSTSEKTIAFEEWSKSWDISLQQILEVYDN